MDLQGSVQCQADGSGFGLSGGDGISQKQMMLGVENFGEPNKTINALLCSPALGQQVSTAPLHREAHGETRVCMSWPCSSQQGKMGGQQEPTAPMHPLEGDTKPPSCSLLQFMLPIVLTAYIAAFGAAQAAWCLGG